MPAACPLEFSRSLLGKKPGQRKDASGLPAGVLTLAARKETRTEKRCQRLARWLSRSPLERNQDTEKMPAACPLEFSRSLLEKKPGHRKMPAACPLEFSRSLLGKKPGHR